MRIFQLLPEGFIDREYLGISVRMWLPILVGLLLTVGLLSPLFNLSELHGVASPRLYAQHFYFDFIAGLGGYWAGGYCKHWYHRIPLFILIDVLTTFALVTIVG